MDNIHPIKKYLIKSSQFGDFKYDQRDDQQIYKDSRVVIIGVPYDGTATYLKGSKYGPEAVLSASVNLETYDETFGNIYEAGIFTAGMINLSDIHTLPEKVIDRVYKISSYFVNDNKFLVTIGGEHSITLGAVKAYKEKYDRLSVLQLDAHLDLMNSYGGTRYSHASVMRRIIEDSNCSVTQVGIRVVSEEEGNYIKEENGKINVFRAKDIYDNNDWFQPAIDSLSEFVYITIDVDGYDPSLMPSTGTPVPGGLDWYRTIGFLSRVYKERKIVGLDVTELKPNPGNEAPNFMAADLIYKNIGFYKEYVLNIRQQRTDQ